MKPMIKLSSAVDVNPTWGSASVKGATPRIENQMTRLRPIRSPSGPPMRVPSALASRKRNRYTCAAWMETWNFSIRKKL